MAVIDTINNAADKAVNVGEDYVKSTREYYTLKVFQQVSYSFSTLYKLVIIGSFLLLGMVFLTISGALYLGKQLGSMPLGCLIVGGALFLIAGIIYLFRKFIDKAVIRKLGDKFFDSNQN